MYDKYLHVHYFFGQTPSLLNSVYSNLHQKKQPQIKPLLNGVSCFDKQHVLQARV